MTNKAVSHELALKAWTLCIHFVINVFPWLFLLAVIAHAPVAAAGTLNIETQTTVKTEKDRLLVTVRVRNDGNEAAHKVQANVNILGKWLKSPVKTLLAVNQPEVFHIERVISRIKPGRYPLTVLVDFHDANEYPFSALAGTTFHYEEDTDTDLACLAHDLIIGKGGGLRFQIRNLGFESKHIHATAALPRELSATRPEIDFPLKPRAEKTISFEITNFSALPGATYPVFCYFEYDLDDTHYTAVTRAVVKIGNRENWVRRTVWFWVGLAVFLGAVLVLYQFKRKPEQL